MIATRALLFALAVLGGVATARAEPPLLSDEQALEEERNGHASLRTSADPFEAPGERYFFAGVAWRYMHMPTWFMKTFTVVGDQPLSTARSVYGEFAYRKNGFQVLGSVGLMKVDVDGAYRLSSDPIEDTEWLSGNFNMLMLTSAVTWSAHFSDWFQLEYGVEGGIALLFGDLTRTEAVRRADGSWAPCSSWASRSSDPSNTLEHNPLLPNPTPEELRYCEVPDGPPGEPPPPTNAADEDGAHYGVTSRHGLRYNGVPRFTPLLGPRVSLRFKPMKQLVVRVDVPLPLLPLGFTGGLSVQYGF